MPENSGTRQGSNEDAGPGQTPETPSHRYGLRSRVRRFESCWGRSLEAIFRIIVRHCQLPSPRSAKKTRQRPRSLAKSLRSLTSRVEDHDRTAREMRHPTAFRLRCTSSRPRSAAKSNGQKTVRSRRRPAWLTLRKLPPSPVRSRCSPLPRGQSLTRLQRETASCRARGQLSTVGRQATKQPADAPASRDQIDAQIRSTGGSSRRLGHA
jgi:hypothetical protein